MKRLIFIIDTLRYDCVEHLGLDGWEKPAFSFADGTLGAFTEISKRVKKFQGKKILFTGGGYVSKVNWEGVEVIDNRLFPLKNLRPQIIQKIKECTNQTLFMVHDYWVHNWWQDIENKKPPQWDNIFRDIEAAKVAYIQRIRTTGEWIQEILVEISENWNVYVTADHGEVFKDDGVHWGHGESAGNCVQVFQIPILGVTIPQNVPDKSNVMIPPDFNYEELWS